MKLGRTLLSIGFSIPVIALAGPGIFGTKVSPIQTNDGGSPVGVFPVVQMLLALAIVLALVKWLMPMLIKKYSGRFVGSSGSSIRVLETASVGPASLTVLTVRGKTLLVGTTASNVSLLADLTVLEPGPATFQEMLDTTPESSPNLSDLAGQLERLRRLGT